MAKYLHIEAYNSIIDDRKQIPDVLLARDKVAIGGASAASGELPSNAKFVALTAQDECQWELNANADGDSRYLAPQQPRFFRIDPGDTIHVIEVQP